MALIIKFIILNIANVIIQTFKSIATIKCNKYVASLVNAVAYGLYTIVVVYMVCDLNLWFKVAVVAGANLVGVFVVKLIEEKSRKDKLWKVETTIPNENRDKIEQLLKSAEISYNYNETIDNHSIFNIFCATQTQSHAVREILKEFNAKYFVTESQTL